MTNINNDIDNKISTILPKYNKNTSKEITNLVLGGGGLKGIAMIGALKTLYDEKLLNNVKNISGTSVGAIIGGLYCIGYTFDELAKLSIKLDLSNIVVPTPANLLNSYSLDTGERREYVLTKLIESKNFDKNITLRDVYKIKKIHLHITTACLNDGQPYYFSYVNAPDMPLLTCMMMSSSIPLIFKPVVYNNRTYVDGSLIDNYPINLFKDDIERTIGIYVKDIKKFRLNLDNMEEYAYSLFECMLEGQAILSTHNHDLRTLLIELPRVSLIGEISVKTKKELYNIGSEQAKKFYKSFRTYQEKYNIDNKVI